MSTRAAADRQATCTSAARWHARAITASESVEPTRTSTSVKPLAEPIARFIARSWSEWLAAVRRRDGLPARWTQRLAILRPSGPGCWPDRVDMERPTISERKRYPMPPAIPAHATAHRDRRSPRSREYFDREHPRETAAGPGRRPLAGRQTDRWSSPTGWRRADRSATPARPTARGCGAPPGPRP